MNEKNLEYYLGLPYTIVLKKYSDGSYFAEVKELPGCMTEVDSKVEVLAMIEDAMKGWIELALSEGSFVPEPDTRENFSGKILIRAPKSLHRELMEKAKSEGVSLNQYLVYQLSKAVKA